MQRISFSSQFWQKIKGRLGVVDTLKGMSKLRWLEIAAPALVLIVGLVYFGSNVPTSTHSPAPKMTSTSSSPTQPAVTVQPGVTEQTGNSSSLDVTNDQGTSDSQTNLSANVNSSTNGTNNTTQVNYTSNGSGTQGTVTNTSDGTTKTSIISEHCNVMTIYNGISSCENMAGTDNYNLQVEEDSAQ